jgi:hypothetical protein
MTPFFKYILINLLFFVLLTAVGYRFLKTTPGRKSSVIFSTGRPNSDRSTAF